jgi:acetolactate synthase-1/2/3 large subunit
MTTATSLTVGQVLIELLRQRGVDTVFGIPGVHTIELYRGLAASPIRHISARHEGALGFMADGYARATGRPGVCFVITGPGVTNIATPMGQAYADSIPMLVISSVNPEGRDGTGNGYLHEMPDQRGIAQRVAAFSHTVTRAEELPQVLDRAFAVFESARPRPVHIALPTTLLGSLATVPVRCRVPVVTRPMPDPAAIDAARSLLAGAKTPLILAGGGAQGGSAALTKLAEALDASCVMTINGRGLLPAAHPLALPVSASLPAIRELIRAADVVLAVGTELGPTDYDMYDIGGFTIPGQLIRVEIDPEQAVRNRVPDLALIGDAGGTLSALLKGLTASGDKGGAARTAAARQAALADLPATDRFDLDCLETIRSVLPEALIVGDSTRQVYAGNLYFGPDVPRRWFNASSGFGALGYGLPAATGAALGTGRTVVCLAGDGGLQFSLAELGTAVEAGVKIILLLLNNQGYGEIKSAMRGAGIAPVGVDLFTPDFCRIAEAYSWSAIRLGATDDLAAALKAAEEQDGPSLIEIGLEGCRTLGRG